MNRVNDGHIDLDAIGLVRAASRARERRGALVMTAIYATMVLAALPWARWPGPVIPQIVSVFTVGIVIADLATSFLLLVQLEAAPDIAVLLVACAYLFSSLMGIAHILTFPGAIVPDLRIVGGPQLTSYVFNEWRLGFAALVLAAALVRGRTASGTAAKLARLRRMLPCTVGVGAILLVVVSGAAERSLPPMIERASFTWLGLAASWAVVATGAAAIVVLWSETRGRDVFSLWLCVALITFCGDMALGTWSESRFSLGWYAGRASGLVSACTLFLVLLVRVAVQQRYALTTTRALRERTIGLQEEMARRTEAENQLRQLQRIEAVGQLTGGIAHDFNNMLAIVIGSLDMARRRLTGSEDPRVKACIDHAGDGARRAATLTARLLAFSRQQPLEPASVDVNRLVAGMSELIQRTLGETVRVETVLAGGLWRTFADPVQLESALVNLAVNARDAMPSGGKLTIETGNADLDERYAAAYADVVPGQYVLVSVTDTGTGMPSEVVERAFDPFYSTKGVGKGTGLGLSQVFGFVKQSGGHVKIYSEVGHGTTVKVYMPRHAGGGVAPTPGAEPVEMPRGLASEIILVVEDEEQVRMMSVDALRELGYTAVPFGSAREALRQLAEQPAVALLFTDVVMPEMGGHALYVEARRSRPDLKVLYTTGYTRNAIVHNGVLDPGIALIPKPFSIQQLAVKVRRVLDETRP